MNELTKNLKCIKLNGGVEIWVEDDKMERLKAILLKKDSEQFIKIGNQIINKNHIQGIFEAGTMEDVVRRRNGQWKCGYGEWHERAERCNCEVKVPDYYKGSTTTSAPTQL